MSICKKIRKESQRIFLIGVRASGKTTVGQELAKQLGWDFIDSDKLIQDYIRCSISSIVKERGWGYFRKIETIILQNCINKINKPFVFATGGGIILTQENCDLMRSNGLVCFLNVSEDILIQRMNFNINEEQRPSLTGKDIIFEISDIIHERLPYYLSTAHYVVDASISITNVTNNIHKIIYDFVKNKD